MIKFANFGLEGLKRSPNKNDFLVIVFFNIEEIGYHISIQQSFMLRVFVQSLDSLKFLQHTVVSKAYCLSCIFL